MRNKNKRTKNISENENQKESKFQIKFIRPLTENQKTTFEYYDQNYHIMLHGCAGTGKTFVSFYLALNEILNQNSVYKQLVIVRSAVATRNVGFMPGNLKEKTRVYESPYISICAQLFERGDAYDVLKTKNLIHFMSTSFVRGITINDSIIIVDECENLNFHELDSIITRVGDNCKIIFCGDFYQSDLKLKDERNDILRFIDVIKMIDRVAFIEFNENDIVRSNLVKEYIIAKTRLQRQELKNI